MKKMWRAGVLIFIVFAVFITLFLTKQKAQADFPSNTYCGVIFGDPVYEFKDASGHSLFALDVNGNLYIYPVTIHLGSAPPSNLVGGFGFKYNNIQKMTVDSTNFYISGSIIEEAINLPNIPAAQEIIFKEPLTQTPIARFDGITGTLDIKGKAIYNGAQSNCTSDHYYTSSGNILWKDFYCNKPSCLFNSIDLDSSMALCQTNDSKWNIGGEIDPTTCCRNDNSGVNLTCNPTSLCSGNTLGEACCDNATNCVYQNNCYNAGANCAPWNSNYLATCTSNAWSYPTNYDCPKECINICQRKTQCSSGSCTGTANCAVGTKCVDHNGCQTGQCNTQWACSSASGDGKYGDDTNGLWSCQANCGSTGLCNYATNCIDCTDPANNNLGNCYQCKRINGLACTSGNQCASGNCVDGVCCNTACSYTCSACDIASHEGNCTFIPIDTDMDNECAAENCGKGTCNGAGACDWYTSGEGTCTACKTCLGATSTSCVALNNVQDAEGLNICTTCKICSSGSCVNQAHQEDLFNECTAGWTYCASICVGIGGDGYCDGYGACDTNDVTQYCNGQVCSSGSCISGRCGGTARYPMICYGGNCEAPEPPDLP